MHIGDTLFSCTCVLQSSCRLNPQNNSISIVELVRLYTPFLATLVALHFGQWVGHSFGLLGAFELVVCVSV